MSDMRPWIAGAIAVVRRDWLIFVSYRTQVLSRSANAMLSVLLFYYISRLVTTGEFSSPDSYFAFVVVGLVITQVINATLGMTPVAIRTDLLTGNLERLIISPFGVVSGVIAMLIFPTAMSLVTGAIMVAFSGLVLGLPIVASTVLWAIPAAILASLSFAPFTLFFSAFVLAFKQAVPGAGYVLVVLGLVAGLYFPVTLLPDWIAWASNVQPFTPAVDLLRYLISGETPDDSVAVLVARLVGFTVVLGPVSVYAVARAVEYGRRRGSLIEY